MPRVFVSVGSNVDPEKNVTRALRLLNDELGIRAISTFYRTPALNRPQDPPFVNGVVEVGDALGPLDLKKVLQNIERTVGTIPHPDLRERPFVAIPLLELAPDLILPDSGKALRSIVDSLPRYPMEPLADLTRRLRTEVADGP